MIKPKILVTDKIDEDGLSLLQKQFDVDKKYGISREDLEIIIDQYTCIITRSSTGADATLMDKAPNLKIIARAAIGVDNIDIQAATARNIAVINAPNGNARSTAEHTLGMIFAIMRHIPQAHADLKEGIWGKTKYVGTQLHGKTLGIVGFGNVGKEVYRVASGIGMNVVVCEPYTKLPKKVRHLTFEQLLHESDIVTFHVPLTYLTKHMLNKSTIGLCKPGAFIINCSRGPVVDDEAIKQALLDKKIAGFAVDVFKKEPPIDVSLLQLPNVVATPHIAGSTNESQRQSVHEVASGILHYLSGTAPQNLLNPQVFKKKKRTIKKKLEFDAIIFDCDSTLCSVEGIDELAGFFGKKAEVSKLTRDAMDGVRKFEEVYQQRLTLLKPSRRDMERLGQLYIDTIIPDAKDIIDALKTLGKSIYLVSGSYTPALLPLATLLNVSEKNIFANDILFNKDGSYVSYFEGPLKRNHGKLQIIRQIPGKKLMVGDGITDLECKELVDLFIGFGGFEKRPHVEKESEIYLYEKSLAPILILAAGYDGCVRLLETKYKKYVGKGLDLLSHEQFVKVQSSRKKNLEEFKKLAYY